MTQPAFVPVHAVRTQPLEVELAPTQRCPYCRDTVAPEQQLVACGDCKTVLHADCAKQGCTTQGCRSAPRLRFVPPRRRRRMPRMPRVRWARVGVALALVASGAGLMGWGQAVWRPPVEVAGPLEAPLLPRTVPLELSCPPLAELPAIAPMATPLYPSALSAYTSGGVAFVRGHLDQPGRLTLEGPDGESLSWDQGRGPFEGTVSLPGPGVHTVLVRFVPEFGGAVESVQEVVVGSR